MVTSSAWILDKLQTHRRLEKNADFNGTTKHAQNLEKSLFKAMD